MVIHKDLYDVIKELTFFKEYRFEEVNNIKINLLIRKKSVYSVFFTNKIIKENSSIVSLIKGNSHYKEYPQQIININSNNNIRYKKKIIILKIMTNLIIPYLKYY